MRMTTIFSAFRGNISEQMDYGMSPRRLRQLAKLSDKLNHHFAAYDGLPPPEHSNQDMYELNEAAFEHLYSEAASVMQSQEGSLAEEFFNPQ